MAPTRQIRERMTGVERIRSQLLTALHLGKLSPGDRAPSVRRLADRTGMNRKTVHRAYTRLAREGLLDLRPGSGTFISEVVEGDADRAPAQELLAAANRCKTYAEALGLAPEAFARFLHVFFGDGLRGRRVAVTECNLEQMAVIAMELDAALGLETRPLLLDKLPRGIDDGSRGAPGAGAELGVVTTACHHAEVSRVAEPRGIPVYRLALDAAFPQRLIEQARRDPVVLAVRDLAFAPVFHRLLGQMSAPDEVIERIHVVDPRRARQIVACQANVRLYWSPLLEPAAVASIRGLGVHPLPMRWPVEAASLERVKTALAMQVATRADGGAPPLPARACVK